MSITSNMTNAISRCCRDTDIGANIVVGIVRVHCVVSQGLFRYGCLASTATSCVMGSVNETADLIKSLKGLNKYYA